MRPCLLTRAREQFSITLLIMLVVSFTLVFEVRAQTASQASNQSGFTIVSTQTITSTESGVARLRGVHVRYQRSDSVAKEIKTYFKEDGTPDPPQIQQYLTRRHHSLSEAALRKNPSLNREEKVLGFQTFVLRDYRGSGNDEYTETFLAPELQDIPIKQIVVTKDKVDVIEPVSILLGEPDEKTLLIATAALGKESQTIASTERFKRIDFSQGVLPGYASKEVKPLYPAEAKESDVYGTVLVQILVSEEGRVIEARPISGPPQLRDAALDAARQWLFKPTLVSGMRVKVQDILTFNFKPQ
jgi:TonB family protein